MIKAQVVRAYLDNGETQMRGSVVEVAKDRFLQLKRRRMVREFQDIPVKQISKGKSKDA